MRTFKSHLLPFIRTNQPHAPPPLHSGFDGSFELVEDDGVTADMSAVMKTPMAWDDAGGVLTIGPTTGAWMDKALANRTFNIVWVRPNVGAGIDVAIPDKSVHYTGEQITIKAPILAVVPVH